MNRKGGIITIEEIITKIGTKVIKIIETMIGKTITIREITKRKNMINGKIVTKLNIADYKYKQIHFNLNKIVQNHYIFL